MRLRVFMYALDWVRIPPPRPTLSNIGRHLRSRPKRAWLVLWLSFSLLPISGAEDLMGPPPPAHRLEIQEAQRQPWGWQEGAIIGASVADLATTEYALRLPGAQEANPLMINRGLRYGLKLAYTGAVVWLYRTLEDKGQHRWAKLVLVWSIALWAGAATWNMAQTG